MKKRFLIYQVVVPVLILFLATDCKKDEPEPAKLAVLSTSPVTNFTTITAASGGNITYNGGAEILSNGVCWSASVNPTIIDSKTVDAVGIAQFVSSISGLTPGMTYHVRAYATNSVGTAYGEDVTFTTLSSNTVADAEGNIYNIITIGVQVWMAENLKAAKYRNGDLIGTTTPATLDITAEATPKYQWASYGDESNVATYGRLYTWYAVTDNRNVCPNGWHVPTHTEWTTLNNYLGGNNISANKLRETGTAHWIAPNAGATNETGFTALPSGYRDGGVYFGNIGEVAEWWSSTEFSAGSIYYWEIYNGNLWNHESGLGSIGFSVRCLRD
jgi:uncharacterized protein (TIGR02145 family)